MTALWLAVVAFLLVKLAGLSVNARLFPRLDALPGDAAEGTAGAGVSLLVPVRNEAATLPATLPGLLAQPAEEIVLYDDASSDGTADVIARLAGGDVRVRCLEGGEPPAGWVGKVWACHRLAEAAHGDRLVFVDADVRLADGALAAAMREMRRQSADVFSVFPRQRTASLPERTLLPLIDDVLLSFLPYPLLRRPVPAAAAANGQFLAFHRAAYDALGGHAGVRDAIVEDVVLAQRTRRAGLRLGLALGGTAVAVRMYDGYRDLVGGLAKSLLAAHGGSRPLMWAGAAWHVVAYTLPLLLTPFAPWWGVQVALAWGSRALLNATTGRGAFWEAVLVPLAPLLALPVYVRASAPRRVWKGRAYA